MDTLTAVRNFAKPGFCPVKRTRIFADRWYKVTFQNIEHGQGDYLGLGQGEYTQLLPGDKARETRGAKLNHCNAIQEHAGDVFEVFTTQYGHMRQYPAYVSTSESADITVELSRREHAKWVADVVKGRENYAAQLAQGKTWAARSIEDCDRIINRGMSNFAFSVKQIR